MQALHLPADGRARLESRVLAAAVCSDRWTVREPDMPSHFGDHLAGLDRLRKVAIAAGGDRLRPVFRERMRRQRDYRNLSRLLVCLDLTCRFPAIESGQSDVHKDQVRMRLAGEGNTLYPVVRLQHSIAVVLQDR